jgi:hypothetical protein
MTTATAQARPNIAFIKYWENCESKLRVWESFLFIMFRPLADFG